MKCRLFYLIGELHTGGSEWQLYCLLRAIDKDIYKPVVAVWNYSENDVHLPLIRALNVPVYSLPENGSRLKKLAALRRLIRQLNPEVVHSWSFYTNFAATFATVGTRALAIGSIRSDFAWALKECGLVLGSLSARWPRTQTCNSFSAAEHIRSLRVYFAASQISVVRNGIDLEKFRSFPVPDDTPVRIVGVGYLLPVKRWERLLAAAHTLKQKGFEFQIQIAGDGPLRLALEKQASALGVGDCIKFLGHIDDVPGLLASAAFVVHTADSEGCPNAVMEAMACGRAVIATETGEIPLLVEDGKTGFVVSCNDNSALVERMERLIADRNTCHRMGKAGRAKIQLEFGLGRSVEENLSVYRTAGWRDERPL